MMDIAGLGMIAPEWLWVIAAAALAIGEIVAPGLFMMWIGGAALLTALATGLLGLPLSGQLLVFAASSVASIYGSRYLAAKNPVVSADPQLNDRAARLIGAIVTAVEPIDATQGRVKVGDGVWSARGTVAAVGDRLRVTALDGGILIVEPV
jgi:inner membrane protein